MPWPAFMRASNSTGWPEGAGVLQGGGRTCATARAPRAVVAHPWSHNAPGRYFVPFFTLCRGEYASMALRDRRVP